LWIIHLTCGYCCREREKAAEKQYFNQEDEKLLRNLMNKLKSTAAAQVGGGAKGPAAAAPKVNPARVRLNEIVGSKLTEAEKDALMEWRTHDF
jgi:hypothetical protein